MVIRAVLWVGLFGAFLFCAVGLGECFHSIDKCETKLAAMQLQIDGFRKHIEALERALKKESARSEDLKYQLGHLQNIYTKVKRDNEEIAHKLIGTGAGVTWAKEVKAKEDE